MSEMVFIGGGNIAHSLVAGLVDGGTEPGQRLFETERVVGAMPNIAASVAGSASG